MSHFKLVISTKASDVVPVKKYVSEKSGITVIIADVEGPVVTGYFCLATEAHDDDGLPHTLEHLIFLGSKRYPYKGILDLLANRCMAHGSCAWTITDHTCYTIHSAGDAGMLALLPVYLDHILNPTLTDEGFMTEVHHIDGDGNDAGVMYCHKQGWENTADSRCSQKLLRAMYPDNGYSAETHGIMENLRVSTDITKVRKFHKKFYRPENLTVILTGQIKAEDVFKALQTVEDDIIEKKKTESLEEWVKPWQTVPGPPIYGEFKEQFPADTEDFGQVLFGWRGPLLTEPTALKDLTACALLLRYLCDTASAPLQRCLVEKEDALAGDIFCNVTNNLASLIKIELDNVPMHKLELARDEARLCLNSVRTGQEPIDMVRMKRLVRRELRESVTSLETDPHIDVAYRCIEDALYSQNEQDFISRMNPQKHLEELLQEGPEYWLGLLEKYFNEELVTIIGSPSIDMQTKMAEDEKQRIELQRAQLGESGLAENAKKLEAAMAFNERAPPPGTLASVPVPACDNLKTHSIKSWSSDGEICPHFDLKEIPMYTRAHSLTTNFVYINLILDTTHVDENTRKWVPILLDSVAECPVHRGDTLVSHEDIISITEQLNVILWKNIGFHRTDVFRSFTIGEFANFIHIATRCEPVDYEEVVRLLHEVLYKAEITKERLLVFAQRLINDVAELRSYGDNMAYATVRDSLYHKNSNNHWATVLRQQKFLKELIEQLNAGGDSAERTIEDAKLAFKRITEKAWLHIAADFEKYKISVEPWKRFASENEITAVEPKLYWDADLMSGWGGGFVVGCGGVESNFLVQMSPGPLGSSAPGDIAPLMVALNYLTQPKGPMWRLIQGSGLSYGYSITPALSEGRLIFSLFQATNVLAAYSKAKSFVEEWLAAGDFDEDHFHSAKNTAIFEVVDKEELPTRVVPQTLKNYLYRVGPTYNSELVCALAGVTAAQAHAAAKRWLPSLFDVTSSKIAIVCHPSKVTDIQTAFDKINVKLEAFESIEAFESMETLHFNK